MSRLRRALASDGAPCETPVFPYLPVVDHASAVRMHPGVSSRFRVAVGGPESTGADRRRRRARALAWVRWRASR
jgi:hypothetical protein